MMIVVPVIINAATMPEIASDALRDREVIFLMGEGIKVSTVSRSWQT